MKNLILFLFMTFISQEIYAQCHIAGTCTQAAGGGATTTVNAANLGGPCRRVTNSNAATIMVPHGSAAEWSGASGFINRTITNVSQSGCYDWSDVTHVYQYFGSPLFANYCGPANSNSVTLTGIAGGSTISATCGDPGSGCLIYMFVNGGVVGGTYNSVNSLNNRWQSATVGPTDFVYFGNEPGFTCSAFTWNAGNCTVQINSVTVDTFPWRCI